MKGNVTLVPIAIAAMLATTPAQAVPALQLDILGGTYDNSTSTIVTSSTSFSVFAYSLSSAGDYFLSIAVQPSATVAGSYGSFTVDGTPVNVINVTGGMTYGTPPIETIAALIGSDPGDLATHSIFPTYYAERPFTFSAAQSGEYDTQLKTGIGPQSLGAKNMYYQRFDIDVGGLAAGLGLHFDLYNKDICATAQGNVCALPDDVDVDKFAPFSHDAEFARVSEPGSLALLLAGLGLLGFGFASRRKAASPA